MNTKANNNPWIPLSQQLPENRVTVETKVDDAGGVRNVQNLRRYNALWFNENGKTYVYYTPTHWRPLE